MKQFYIIILLLIGIPCKATDRRQLPNFTGYEINSNRTVPFDDFKGQLIYLDFWASWCGPCLESLPFLEYIHQAYQGKGIIIIGVNIDEDRNNGMSFLKTHSISFLNLYDPKGFIGKKLGVKNMPTAFLINKDGNILFKHVGFDKNYSNRLDETISKLLNAE